MIGVLTLPRISSMIFARRNEMTKVIDIQKGRWRLMASFRFPFMLGSDFYLNSGNSYEEWQIGFIRVRRYSWAQ